MIIDITESKQTRQKYAFSNFWQPFLFETNYVINYLLKSLISRRLPAVDIIYERQVCYLHGITENKANNSINSNNLIHKCNPISSFDIQHYDVHIRVFRLCLFGMLPEFSLTDRSVISGVFRDGETSWLFQKIPRLS